MSSQLSSRYYPASRTLPVPVPVAKDQYAIYYPVGESTFSVSPPEADASVSSGSGMALSYSGSGYSVTTSGYESSNRGDLDSTSSAGGVDINEYMQERFAETFDLTPLDRCMAVQAKTSGHLNAKHRQLLELQAKAQARLAKSRTRFAEGLEHAREVREDLEWTQNKVTSLRNKASKKHSKAYSKACARFPTPE